MGVPTRETKKALAWDITSGFGVVVQIDQPSTGEYALIWLPHNADALKELSCEKVVYPEEKGRHSNTYASPGLKRGDAAIRAKVKQNKSLTSCCASYSTHFTSLGDVWRCGRYCTLT
ncbi:hypothetical protein VCHA54P489_130087 [Vibrio chagasii]|nr:hypothetical protein VCHA54P489_130087 [Vibrio chagasii]CAH6944499.1 hypothetical protein VCHA37P202_110079 [Vibrio chagasii]CAH7107224.1 hypothetical protein VCHA49P380_10323 [Vibrio chagasii]